MDPNFKPHKTFNVLVEERYPCGHGDGLSKGRSLVYYLCKCELCGKEFILSGDEVASIPIRADARLSQRRRKTLAQSIRRPSRSSRAEGESETTTHPESPGSGKANRGGGLQISTSTEQRSTSGRLRRRTKPSRPGQRPRRSITQKIQTTKKRKEYKNHDIRKQQRVQGPQCGGS